MTLVDTNVILDIATRDPRWHDWSMERLSQGLLSGGIAINPLIYAEISAGYPTEHDIDDILTDLEIRRLPLPYDAAFLAGKAFLAYRKRGGTKRSPLPDFYIGAHAATAGLPLLTRDPTRYRSYFPNITLIAPAEGDP